MEVALLVIQRQVLEAMATAVVEAMETAVVEAMEAEATATAEVIATAAAAATAVLPKAVAAITTAAVKATKRTMVQLRHCPHQYKFHCPHRPQLQLLSNHHTSRQLSHSNKLHPQPNCQPDDTAESAVEFHSHKLEAVAVFPKLVAILVVELDLEENE